MRMPAAVQSYFMMVHVGSYSSEDGRIVGHLLMDAVRYTSKIHVSKREKKRRATAVAKFVMRTAMLSDTPFGNLCDMLIAILGNTLQGVKEVASTDPTRLTQAEAVAIGESCKTIRLRHVHAKEAVDELLHNYVALRTASQSYAWFRPFLETILLRQTQASRLDRMIKVTYMAGLSTFDVATDILTIGNSFWLGQIGTAIAITGLVFLSQAVQIVVVVLKNAHCGRRAVLKEVGIVISFFKPTIDVARMLRGHEVAGAPFSTRLERAICKIVESVFESIPSMLLQLSQGLSQGNLWSWVTLLSIAISWTTTASKVGTMAFDLDGSLESRAGAPEFYGYVPDSFVRRTIAQTFLILVGLATIIGTSVAIALLVATEPAWVAALLCGDLGVMFMYKVARNDLYVWVPGSGIGVALLYRSVSTLMARFTSLVHMRHPCELGGLWWFVTMLLIQIECFLAGWLYLKYYAGPGKFETDVLYTGLGSLAGLWAVSFIGFLLSIERSYVRTFFSLESGAAFAQGIFTKNEGNDARRSGVLGYNHRLWLPIRGDVSEWMEVNWPAWKQDPPLWFTPEWVDSIPDDMLPKSLFAAMMAPQPALGPAGKLPLRRGTVRKSIVGSLVPGLAPPPMQPEPSSLPDVPV
jgi:hypothetical protein